jgi:hypothetical protein
MSSLKTSYRCPKEENSNEKLKELHHCGDENIEEEISKSKTTTTTLL